MIFVDSSFYISLSVVTDKNHEPAVEIAPRVTETKVTSEDILKETLTVVSQREGKLASIQLYEELSSDTEVFPVTSARFQAGLALFLNPKLQKDVSLIDCITTAICKEMGIKRILTFDPHFRLLGLTPRL